MISGVHRNKGPEEFRPRETRERGQMSTETIASKQAQAVTSPAFARLATPWFLSNKQARQREAALGAFMGQATGDSLGSQVEFHDPEYIRQRFPNGVRTMGHSRVWNTEPGQVTDDTEMALSLAHALVSGFSANRIGSWYVRWLTSGPFDVGGTCGAAISGGLRRPKGTSLSSAMFQSARKESKANGALMRNVALAIWASRFEPETPEEEIAHPSGAIDFTNDHRRIASWARSEASLTHPNETCVEANIVNMIMLVHMIRDGFPPSEAFEQVLSYRENFVTEDIRSTIDRMSDTIESGFKATLRIPRKEQAGRVDIALRLALYVTLSAEIAISRDAADPTQVFEDSISWVAGFGGETDTNSGIAGSMLGAYVGIRHIPTDWVAISLACDPGKQAFHERPNWLWPSQIPDLVDHLMGFATEESINEQKAPVVEPPTPVLPAVVEDPDVLPFIPAEEFVEATEPTQPDKKAEE